MYDHQTDSLWSQFFGEAVDGPLKGTKLDVLPVLQSSWGEWLELHPDTLVLDKRGGYASDPYNGYYRGGSKGVIGEGHRDKRLEAKDLVLALSVENRAKAYFLEALKAQSVVNDTVGGREILVVFEPSSEAAVAYSRRVGDQVLTFVQTQREGVPQPVMTDRETGTTWLLLTGQAAEGPLAGEALERVPTHYSFWFAWTDFHPDTELFGGEGQS